MGKTKPVADILALCELGHAILERIMCRNYGISSRIAQDIRMAFIGIYQSNKVKFILPFVYMIHGVDSYKLLKEINKQAAKL